MFVYQGIARTDSLIFVVYFFSHFQAIPKLKTWLDVTKELTASLQTCFSHGGTAVHSVFSQISEEGPLPASPLLGLLVLAIL